MLDREEGKVAASMLDHTRSSFYAGPRGKEKEGDSFYAEPPAQLSSTAPTKLPAPGAPAAHNHGEAVEIGRVDLLTTEHTWELLDVESDKKSQVERE